MSLKTQILALLEKNPKKKFKTEEIAAELEADEDEVQDALDELERADDLEVEGD
jgi:DNA-directed RNA polymerase specialized sigma subunit